MFDLLFVALVQAAGGSATNVIQVAPPAHVRANEPDSVRERRERHALRCRDRVVTGSRIGNRVCMSQAEEEQMQRDTQDIAHRMQRSGPWDGTLPTGPGGP